jgi:hypothetical protein
MRPYSVRWLRDARLELARIWISAKDPYAIRAASEEIEKLLGEQAGTCGEPLGEGLFKLIHEPLVVLYTVDVVAQSIEVVWIRSLDE